jgi:sugar-specific transcriptional regulator TrmB
MDVSILKEIGLTDSEIKVFTTLLRVGPAKAGKVIDYSKLQNPVVHRAFHSLIEKGLLTYSVEGKIKYYTAIDPNLLLNIVDERRQKLEDLIPKLQNLTSYSKGKTKATIHQGKRGVRELLYLLLETKEKELFAYGAPGKSLDILGDFFWKSFHKRRAKKKIKARMIFHVSLKHRVKLMNEFPKTEIRITQKDFEELAETFICGERVAIVIYLDDPIGILIEEKLAADSYKRFFSLLWSQCKKT